MTELTPAKTVTRRTGAMIRDGGKLRNIVVKLHPGFIEVRMERSKHTYSLSYTDIYQRAADKAAQRLMAERKAAAKAKREGRGK